MLGDQHMYGANEQTQFGKIVCSLSTDLPSLELHPQRYKSGVLNTYRNVPEDVK